MRRRARLKINEAGQIFFTRLCCLTPRLSYLQGQRKSGNFSSINLSQGSPGALLFQMADAALYAAKQAGRIRVTVAPVV